jgi:hypothetical protein
LTLTAAGRRFYRQMRGSIFVRTGLPFAEKAFCEGTMDRRHLDNIKSKRLRNISSLAFGGPDLKTVYL